MDEWNEQLEQLVQKAQSGSRQAQGELLLQFQDVVMGVAFRRLGNYAESQELCQEVFVQVLMKLHQLREPACFPGWIRAIAHRMAINRGVRRAICVPTEPQTFEATCIEEQTPLLHALKSERAEHVRDGLQRLGRMDRETLVAFYVHGQSLIEMSNRFEAPIGTIKRRLHVARKRLAVEIEEHFGGEDPTEETSSDDELESVACAASM